MESCCTIPETKKAPPVHKCPACGDRGKKVERVTVEHLLHTGLLSRIGETQYYFCETATCPTVYFPFDAGAPLFEKSDLRVRVGLKETEDPVPICYCFGLTRIDILDEINTTGTSTVVGRIKAEVQAGNCACEVKNPSGKCCLGNVMKLVTQKHTINREIRI